MWCMCTACLPPAPATSDAKLEDRVYLGCRVHRVREGEGKPVLQLTGSGADSLSADVCRLRIRVKQV